MKDNIQDLVKNVVSTGFFDKIKVTADNSSVILEAIEKEKEVVLKGQFNKPIDGLEGEFGLSNLSILGHIANDQEFNSKDSNITVTYDDRSGERLPVELAYVNKSKTYINYRFMSKQLVPNQPTFREPTWEITIKPSKSSIQQFAWAANGLVAYEQYFTPRVVNGELKFFIGEETAASQRGGVVFATGVTEKFDHPHKWKISYIQNVLKLADSSECEMSFSSKGVIQVSIGTGIGVYKFIFPAKVT